MTCDLTLGRPSYSLKTLTWLRAYRLSYPFLQAFFPIWEKTSTTTFQKQECFWKFLNKIISEQDILLAMRPCFKVISIFPVFKIEKKITCPIPTDPTAFIRNWDWQAVVQSCEGKEMIIHAPGVIMKLRHISPFYGLGLPCFFFSQFLHFVGPLFCMV